jgi:uncharacterized protein YegJ (DUF2314 family)
MQLKQILLPLTMTTSLLVIGCSASKAPVPKAPSGFTFAQDDDPELKKASQEARDHWSEFVQAFSVHNRDEKFAIKAVLYNEGKSEYKWITVGSIYDDKVVGRLNQDSAVLPNVKAGTTVTVKAPDVMDWAYVDSKGVQHGGFSQKILEKRSGK